MIFRSGGFSSGWWIADGGWWLSNKLDGEGYMTPEIAYTGIGRNALFTGLISHVAAILVAMMSASGREHFFGICLFSLLPAPCCRRFCRIEKQGLPSFNRMAILRDCGSNCFSFTRAVNCSGTGIQYPEKRGGETRQPVRFASSVFQTQGERTGFVFADCLSAYFIFSASRQDDPYFKKGIGTIPAGICRNLF